MGPKELSLKEVLNNIFQNKMLCILKYCQSEDTKASLFMYSTSIFKPRYIQYHLASSFLKVRKYSNICFENSHYSFKPSPSSQIWIGSGFLS